MKFGFEWWPPDEKTEGGKRGWGACFCYLYFHLFDLCKMIFPGIASNVRQRRVWTKWRHWKAAHMWCVCLDKATTPHILYVYIRHHNLSSIQFHIWPDASGVRASFNFTITTTTRATKLPWTPQKVDHMLYSVCVLHAFAMAATDLCKSSRPFFFSHYTQFDSKGFEISIQIQSPV